MRRRRVQERAIVAALALLGGSARAQDHAEEAEAPAPAPYSLPWQLRPVTVGNAVRPQMSVARYDEGGREGTTVVAVVTAMARIPGTGPPTAGLAPVIRVASVRDMSPTDGVSRTLANPAFGLLYTLKLDDGWRVGFFLAATYPVGDGVSSGHAAKSKGANARAQFDNALFAVNDVAIVPGVSAAWIKRGATIQGEATFIEAERVRAGAATQPEASKTALTCGLHVGFFAAEWLSFGGELRYQRWLDGPFAVERDPTRQTIDNTSIAVGPRVHLRVGDHVWLRPGISYQRVLDPPLGGALDYRIAQLDLPIVFL